MASTLVWWVISIHASCTGTDSMHRYTRRLSSSTWKSWSLRRRNTTRSEASRSYWRYPSVEVFCTFCLHLFSWFHSFAASYDIHCISMRRAFLPHWGGKRRPTRRKHPRIDPFLYDSNEWQLYVQKNISSSGYSHALDTLRNFEVNPADRPYKFLGHSSTGPALW